MLRQSLPPLNKAVARGLGATIGGNSARTAGACRRALWQGAARSEHRQRRGASRRSAGASASAIRRALQGEAGRSTAAWCRARVRRTVGGGSSNCSGWSRCVWKRSNADDVLAVTRVNVSWHIADSVMNVGGLTKRLNSVA